MSLTTAERAKILFQWNNTELDIPDYQCIHELFQKHAESTPDRIALVCETEQLTYQELNLRANKLARYLKKLGVGPEIRVGICLERSLDLILSVLGILKAGGCYVPLDPSLPKSRMDLMLKDCQAKVILTHQHLYSNAQVSSTKLVYLDKDAGLIRKESDITPVNLNIPANLIYHIFTSGSTGKPKGVMLEHRQLFNYIHAIYDKLRITHLSNFATVSTLAADLGNTVVFPALCSGGSLHIISQSTIFDSEKFGKYFQNNPIDYLKITPSHLEALMNSDNPEKVISCGCLILGGEALKWETVEKIKKIAPHCTVFNHYGPTETTVGSICCPVKDVASFSHTATVPLGSPIANTQIYILGNSKQPIPITDSGELFISGNGVSRGYHNRYDLTAEKFIPAPYGKIPGSRMYRTGDLGRWHQDGNIEFMGRIDHQVKIRGYRIELGEIESVLLRHPAIANNIVLPLKVKPGEKSLVAYLVCDPTRIPSVFEVRSFVEQHLPDYMVPLYFVFMDKFPLMPNGKVDRAGLPAPESPCGGIRYEPPKHDVEKKLVDIWKEILSLDKVGVNDNFFIMGGHSILVMRLVDQLHRTFKVEVSLTQIYEFSTIADLAPIIIKRQREQVSVRENEFEKILSEVENMSPEIVELELAKGRYHL